MKTIIVLYAICLSLVWCMPTEKNVDPELIGGYVEGDMILNQQQRNGIADASWRWPEGIIPYKFVDDFKASEVNMILKVFEYYQNKTCIKFRVKTDDDKAYVSLQNKNTGCFAAVGYYNEERVVNLEDRCFNKIGTVMHELMHSIGFFHEQSRSDRDQYVQILWENIEEAKKTNFLKYEIWEVDDFGIEYDYTSVMHYGPYAFSKNQQPTIVPMDPNAPIGQRENLSDSDLAKIRLMYNCNNN